MSDVKKQSIRFIWFGADGFVLNAEKTKIGVSFLRK